MIFLGVDPGKTGAIAAIDTDIRNVHIFDFEDKAWMRYLTNEAMLFGAVGVIEKVNAMPKQGVTSSFNFGANFGYWQGIFDGSRIPYDLVIPTKWQKEVFDSGKKTADRKTMALERARRLFPGMMPQLARKMDHNRADALLIAEYCRRTWNLNNPN